MADQPPSPPYPPSTAAGQPHVLVLGGGIIGVTQAYFLLRRGLSVTLVERNAAVGDFTSRANAGLVSAGCSQPWNAPGVPRAVLNTLGRADAPYLFRLRAFPTIIPWALRFLANCRATQYAAASRASMELALYSLARFREVADDHDLAFDRLQNGVLKYFEGKTAFEQESRAIDAAGPHGADYRVLDRDALVALEPTLQPHFDRIAGGIHFPSDESGDASRFAKALARQCVAMGARILTGRTIERIVVAKGEVAHVIIDGEPCRADRYVLCLGPHAPIFARQLGFAIPIYPVKGYSVTIETQGRVALPRVPFIDWGRKIAVTAFGTRIRAAGTAEFCGYDDRLSPERLRGLRTSLEQLFPAIDPAMIASDWTGLRPVTPDGLPILGASPVRNLFLNAGHGPHGWGLSCGSSAVVADMVAGEQPDIPIGAFGLTRS